MKLEAFPCHIVLRFYFHRNGEWRPYPITLTFSLSFASLSFQAISPSWNGLWNKMVRVDDSRFHYVHETRTNLYWHQLISLNRRYIYIFIFIGCGFPLCQNIEFDRNFLKKVSVLFAPKICVQKLKQCLATKNKPI